RGASGGVGDRAHQQRLVDAQVGAHQGVARELEVGADPLQRLHGEERDAATAAAAGHLHHARPQRLLPGAEDAGVDAHGAGRQPAVRQARDQPRRARAAMLQLQDAGAHQALAHHAQLVGVAAQVDGDTRDGPLAVDLAHQRQLLGVERELALFAGHRVGHGRHGVARHREAAVVPLLARRAAAVDLVEAAHRLQHQVLGADLDGVRGAGQAEAELEGAALVGEQRVDGVGAGELAELRVDRLAAVEVDARPSHRVLDREAAGPPRGGQELEQVHEREESERARHGRHRTPCGRRMGTRRAPEAPAWTRTGPTGPRGGRYTAPVPKRLPRALLRETAGLYPLGVAAICLLLSVDLLSVLARFLVEQGATLADVLSLLLYRLPWFLHLALPVAVVFAVLLAAGRMAKDSELNAAYALGVPPAATLAP